MISSVSVATGSSLHSLVAIRSNLSYGKFFTITECNDMLLKSIYLDDAQPGYSTYLPVFSVVVSEV